MFKEEQIPEFSFLLANELMRASFREWLDVNQLTKFMSQLDLVTNEEKICFLTNLSLTIRKLPEALFTKPDVRINIFQVVQGCLDKYITESISYD